MPSYQTTQIPIHLQKYVVDQAYEKYTWRDHAVWRFVMHRNIAFLKEHAHDSYISGLAQTGISIEKIPTLDDMNQILNQIGWSAVCVDGFIPPEAFMEFQANKILVVAADIRHFKQIEYTPAPDILHEAAGHAPIISNPSYSQYLQEFGKLGVKAFSSATDHELYQAIRTLSELKCRQSEQSPEIVECEKRIAELEANKGNPSEMALLRNLHWWTVEYGLVGEMENPKIYGAGLLSSLAESNSVVNPAIKKIRYSLEAMHYSFDITHVQPQLFVSSDFDQLTNVLAAFSSQMAFKKGGAEAILKAIDSKHEAVCELSSGIQIVGVFTEVILSGADIVYLKTSGPTELAYKDKILEGHGQSTHFHGFGTPIGRLRNCKKPIRFLDESDLESLHIRLNQPVTLTFLSGLKVKGKLEKILKKDNRILIMSFVDCTVTYKKQLLFQPEWGVYDLAIGDQLDSAYNGTIKKSQFTDSEIILPKTSRESNFISPRLNQIYKTLRSWREQKSSLPNLENLIEEIKKEDAEDWLIIYELIELANELKDQKNLHLLQRYLDTIKDKPISLLN